jgi:hypothetical protein
MKNLRKLAVLSLFALVAACASTRNDAVAPKGEAFGKALPAGEPIAAVTLLHHPENYDGKRVMVEGDIAEVCKVKGCWMVMAEGGKKMRVTFEDYGFFVPKDCAGRKVRVEGAFAVKEISVADAKHYLEDAGKHEDAAKITQPIQELTLVASGVQFLDAK